MAALRQGREPRYIGHNPLGAWMIVALLASVAGLALPGWPYTVVAATGHSARRRVLFTGRRQRESLVRAMLSGRKRRPSDDRAEF
jgi:cytochrome b